MIVRKLKNPTHGAKIEALQESINKGGKIISEEMRMSLSKTIGSSQKIISLKKGRSSSALKQKLSQMMSTNVTPLNKKSRNKSYLIGNSSDIIDLSQASKSSIDPKQNVLSSVESWLSDQLKTDKANSRHYIYLEALQKLTTYDQSLKKILSIIIGGLNDCSKPVGKILQKPTQADVETEKYRSQITELRNSIKDLMKEKKAYKKNIDQFNLILAYMKKQGVPVEQHIQKFCEHNIKKEEKNSLSSSMKVIPKIEETKASAVPKLSIVPPSGDGFHQEFMARVDEFSESWRQLLKNEKSIQYA
ncbi:hypothetical protein SteCoe_37180 [Stentor coeruleus]|uniref:Uncharacterized protein n=1 Tax=Stentor coeruleus TaxID=5963 RepID=A0A1R2ANN5_9CILI|nr:hypothetical protein SteCoe_37180 [Stentor coeruleus]